MRERKWYPGTGANPLHNVLVGLDGLQRLSTLAVVLLFSGYALGLYWVLPEPDWPVGAWAAGAAFDGAVVFALPRFRKSFGPPKSGWILLAVLRWIVAGVMGTIVPLRFFELR